MNGLSSETSGTLPVLTKTFAFSLEGLARRSEAFVIPLLALIFGMVLFSVFLITQGKSPLDFLDIVWRGGFGSWFSIQNT